MSKQIENMKCALVLFTGMLAAQQAFAGNVTISGSFDGTEPSMPVSASSCDATPKPYRDVSTFEVSTSGTFRITDGGDSFPGSGLDAGIADVILLIYSGPFDPNTPASNLAAQVDISADVALSSGTTYRLVVQHWCDEVAGAFAAVIDGPGDITGAGFSSQAYTMGEFLGGSPTANFPDLGVHRYQASGPVILPRSGNYFLYDMGPAIDASFVIVKVYDQSFDPNNPEENLVATSQFNSQSMITIDGSGTYVFVAVDIFDIVNLWQFVLYPPGNISFNPGMTGAWGTPGVDAAGILMEIFQNAGLMFMAWFTYPDQLLVTQAATVSTESDGGVTKPEAHLGSNDQRWLTAFGILPDDSNFMNIAYENATGGLFNQSEPVAMIDSNYGTGWIELFSCSHFALNYNLPDGLVRTTEMRRLVNDGVAYCRSFIKAAPPSPPF